MYQNVVRSIKVSVIVPVYNVEKYLRQCLDSLVNQTINDFEIIVVNDGSTDASQSIIDEYKAAYPDLIHAYIKQNGGLSDARNYGVKRARGEYVGFVDSDDYAELNMFEELYNTASKGNYDVAVCYMNNIKENGVSKIMPLYYINTFPANAKEVPEILFACKSYAVNKIFRKELFSDNNIYFPVGQAFEDSAVVYNLLLKANCIALTDKALYNYRVDRPDSITNSCNESMFDIFKSCDNIIKFCKENDLYDEMYEVIENICRIHIFARINSLKNINNKKFRNRFINAAYDYLDLNFNNWRNNKYYQYGYKRLIKKKTKRSFTKAKNSKYRLKLYFFVPKKIRKILKKIFWHKKKTKKVRLSLEQLHLLQKTELDILKTIDKICKEINIKYFLAEGTLLGAVRHGGFIPWDDDIDIAMMRDDYNKFTSYFNTRIIDDCKLCNSSTIENYHLPFSKVVTLKNTGFENIEAYSLNNYNGVYIDVFPLDKAVEYSNIQNKRRRKIRRYRDMLLFKSGYQMKYTVERFVSKLRSYFVSFNYIHKKIEKLATYYNNKEQIEYIANYYSSYKLNRQTFPKEAFEEIELIKFEDCLLPIPKQYDLVLSIIYGDYMKLPPLEKRTCKHSFKYILE